MSKYKEYNQDQIMLLPPSLEEKIPEKHIARYISKVVDDLDISEIDKNYSDIGRSAYHPKMLLKVLIYGYSLNVRSSRRIQREIKEDLVFMWLAGMQEPDFRTISDFRKDRVKDIKELFKQVLGVCGQLGMVRCGKIYLDGTKIEANSSRYKMTYRKMLNKRKDKYEEIIDKIFEEAEKIDAEEDALYGEHDGYSMDRVYSSEEIKKALDKVRGKRKKLEGKKEKVKEKLELIEEKMQRMGNNRNSFGNTDKDATLMPMKEGYLGVGYNVQMATENQVIVGYEAFENPNDCNLLKPMVEDIENNTGKTPEFLTTDKGYGSHKNYEYMEEKGIRAAIPHQNYDYDRVARNKGTYTLSKNLPYERIKLRMMDYLETEEGKMLMKTRKKDIEATFGDIKYNMGFRKFLVRLKPKIRIELGLISIAHNIKKIKGCLEYQEKALSSA